MILNYHHSKNIVAGYFGFPLIPIVMGHRDGNYIFPFVIPECFYRESFF